MDALPLEIGVDAEEGTLEWARQFAQKMQEMGFIGARGTDIDGGFSEAVIFDPRNVAVTPSERRGQEVLDLLKSGRASEVTDDMLDLGDPVLNAQLNEYLYRNYDLPMDEASRMARAREMGRGGEWFSGTGVDVVAYDPAFRGSSTGASSARAADWLTSSPNEASEYAELAQENIPTNRIQAAMARAERARDWEEHQRLIEEWEAMDAEGFSGANVMPLAGPADVAELDAGGREYFNFTPEINAALRDARAQDGLIIRNLRDAPRGAEWKDPTDHLAVFDPTNIRSRFARFDPRLAHLRNLSAGVGGLGIALGLQPSDEEELRNYLQ